MVRLVARDNFRCQIYLFKGFMRAEIERSVNFPKI